MNEKTQTVCVYGKNLKIRLIHPENPDEMKKKPILVFLHEGLGCIDMWKEFPDMLCRKTGLGGLIYDRLGYGGSEISETPFSPDYLKNEALLTLPVVLEALEINDVILVGHSDGGSIAIIAAAMWRGEGLSRIHGIIAEAAHIFVEPVTVKGIEETVSAYESTDLKDKLSKYHGDRTESVFRRWADIWLSDAFRSFNLEDLVPQIHCPMLFLQGDEDEYATFMHLERIFTLATARPKEDLPFPTKAKLIKGARHVPHLQAKLDVLDEMGRFISIVIQNSDN